MLQQTHTYGTSRATPPRAKHGLELRGGELRPFQYTNASRTERSDAVVSGCRSEEADGGEIIVSYRQLVGVVHLAEHLEVAAFLLFV